MMGSASATGDRSGLVDLPGVALAAFLSVGLFKGDPRLQALPVDATLLMALGVAGLVFLSLLRSGFRFPKNVGWMALLVALFAIPLPWTDLHPYAMEKTTRFFTLTLLAGVAPFLLMRERGAIARFFNALCLISAVLSVDAGLQLLQGAEGVSRLSAFGSNPIAFGRAMGAIFLWCSMLGIEGRLHAGAAALGIGVSGVLLVASGSRGPLLTAVGCLALAGLLYYRQDRRLQLRLALAGAAVAVALSVAWMLAPRGSEQRIEELAQGQLGSSELTRLDAYERSLRLIAVHPEGVGWGGFASLVDQLGIGGADRQYPHNMVIEVLLEGGWVAGGYLIALFAACGLRIARLPSTYENRGLLVFFLFYLLNAMVTGDLNDNRHLFALMAMGLQAGWEHAEAQGGAHDIGAPG